MKMDCPMSTRALTVMGPKTLKLLLKVLSNCITHISVVFFQLSCAFLMALYGLLPNSKKWKPHNNLILCPMCILVKSPIRPINSPLRCYKVIHLGLINLHLGVISLVLTIINSWSSTRCFCYCLYSPSVFSQRCIGVCRNFYFVCFLCITHTVYLNRVMVPRLENYVTLHIGLELHRQMFTYYICKHLDI